MSFGEDLRSFAAPVVLVALGMAVAAFPPPTPPDGIAAARRARTECALTLGSSGNISLIIAPAITPARC